MLLGECPSDQRERAVNPPAYAYVGLNPSSPTILTRGESMKYVMMLSSLMFVAACSDDEGTDSCVTDSDVVVEDTQVETDDSDVVEDDSDAIEEDTDVVTE